jgi:predicted RND superfamily exporter protein
MGPNMKPPHHRRRLSLWVLVLLGLLSAGLALPLGQLRFDYNIEKLFPDSDPELQFFREFRARYENENDYLAIALVNEKGIFEQEFLMRVDSLCRTLGRLENVLEVISLTNTRYQKLNVWGQRRQVPLVHLTQPEKYARDSSFAFSLPNFVDNLFSRDARALCLYLKIRGGLEQEKGLQLLAELETEIQAFDFAERHLSGGLYSQSLQTQMLQKEMWRLGLISLGLILLALTFIFRSLRGVIAPLLVIGFSVIWTTGIMAWLEVEINVMTVLIPSILMVVGMSDVIHLLNRYLEELRHGRDRAEALRLTLREVGLATFLTSITTALGFLTLVGAGIAPYRQLGAFAAVGVLIAYLLTFTLLPAWLVLWPQLRTQAFFQQAHHWHRWLHRSLALVFRYRQGIGMMGLIVVVLSLAGLNRLQIEAHVSDELAPQTQLYQDTRFFDQHFGGVRPFAMSVAMPADTGSLLDGPVIRELEKLDRYLLESYGVNRPYSLLGNLKAGHCSLNDGSPRFYRLPRSEQALQELVSLVLLFGEETGLYDILSHDHRHSRITGSMPDLGLQEMKSRDAALMAFVQDSLNPELLAVQLTGSARLLDRSQEQVVANILGGLGLGILVVALLMGLYYRSWRMWGVALVVNLLPLLMIGGLMGWLGIDLKMSTALIFALAFGIAVDDTIHFISKLKLELRKGRTLPAAIKRTFLTVGKAIVLTSLVLAAGFGVLMGSDFQGTFYTGLLVGLTLVFALLADLVFLPVLLLWWLRL